MIDIILDTDYDITIEDGDFKLDESVQQEVECILKAKPGQYYQWPLLGVGIEQYRKKPINDTRDIEQSIRVNLESDSILAKNLKVYKSVDNIGIDLQAERIK